MPDEFDYEQDHMFSPAMLLAIELIRTGIVKLEGKTQGAIIEEYRHC